MVPKVRSAAPLGRINAGQDKWARGGLTNARDSLIETAVAQNPSAECALVGTIVGAKAGTMKSTGEWNAKVAFSQPLLINEAGWPRLKMPSHRRGLSAPPFLPRESHTRHLAYRPLS